MLAVPQNIFFPVIHLTSRGRRKSVQEQQKLLELIVSFADKGALRAINIEGHPLSRGRVPAFEASVHTWAPAWLGQPMSFLMPRTSPQDASNHH